MCEKCKKETHDDNIEIKSFEIVRENHIIRRIIVMSVFGCIAGTLVYGFVMDDFSYLKSVTEYLKYPFFIMIGYYFRSRKKDA